MQGRRVERGQSGSGVTKLGRGMERVRCVIGVVDGCIVENDCGHVRME